MRRQGGDCFGREAGGRIAAVLVDSLRAGDFTRAMQEQAPIQAWSSILFILVAFVLPWLLRKLFP
jgi:hypothetical protein